MFFIAPGPLTFDLFERGFDSRMALWLGAVLVGTGIAGLRGALPGVEPRPYIIRFTEDRPNPLYRRVCYTFAWSEVITFAVLNIDRTGRRDRHRPVVSEADLSGRLFPAGGIDLAAGRVRAGCRVSSRRRKGRGTSAAIFTDRSGRCAGRSRCSGCCGGSCRRRAPSTSSSWPCSSASWRSSAIWPASAASAHASDRSRRARGLGLIQLSHRLIAAIPNRRCALRVPAYRHRIWPCRTGLAGWDEYAPFYDWENARTLGRADVAFWRRVARKAGGTVLELGCGTGRISLPLARAGVSLVGVDRSAADARPGGGARPNHAGPPPPRRERRADARPRRHPCPSISCRPILRWCSRRTASCSHCCATGISLPRLRPSRVS